VKILCTCSTSKLCPTEGQSLSYEAKSDVLKSKSSYSHLFCPSVFITTLDLAHQKSIKDAVHKMSATPSDYFTIETPSTTYTRHEQVVSPEDGNTLWTEIEARHAAQQDLKSRAPLTFTCSNKSLVVRPSIIEGTAVEIIRLSNIKPVPECPIDPKGNRSNTLHTSKITIVLRKASKAQRSQEPNSYFVTEHKRYIYASSFSTGENVPKRRTILTEIKQDSHDRFRVWF
jgi:hypothetical protein